MQQGHQIELARLYMDNIDNVLENIKHEISEQFTFWNMSTLGNLIPSCNYDLMLDNIMGIIKYNIKKKK